MRKKILSRSLYNNWERTLWTKKLRLISHGCLRPSLSLFPRARPSNSLSSVLAVLRDFQMRKLFVHTTLSLIFFFFHGAYLSFFSFSSAQTRASDLAETIKTFCSFSSTRKDTALGLGLDEEQKSVGHAGGNRLTRLDHFHNLI